MRGSRLNKHQAGPWGVIMELELIIDGHCFVCGPENPHGLRLQIEYGDGRATATFTPQRVHQGYRGVSHGGIMAALLDEVMVYAAVSRGRLAATAEMTTRFIRPAQVGETIRLTATVVRHRRRLIECEAEALSPAGELLASATGKLLQGEAFEEFPGRESGLTTAAPTDQG